MNEKMPEILKYAAQQYDRYGSPSKFHNYKNGRLTTRTITAAIEQLPSGNVQKDLNNTYHVFHHPQQTHADIDDLDLYPYHESIEHLHDDLCIYLVNSSSFISNTHVDDKKFGARRISRVTKILFGNVNTTRPTYKYIKQLLFDISSFHLVLIMRVNSIEEVNPSLRDLLPRSDEAKRRCRLAKFSVPTNWSYFRLTCFSKDFFKSGDLDQSCCRLLHALGVIRLNMLAGSIGRTENTSEQNIRDDSLVNSIRQRNFDASVKEQLDEFEEKKSYTYYLLRRVCMSMGREGMVFGIIDGGEDEIIGNRPRRIKTFSVRFISNVCINENQYYESLECSKDQVAIGLVQAKNKRRKGRSNLSLNHDAWNTGKIFGRMLTESDL